MKRSITSSARIGTAALLLAATLLQGCAGLRPGYETPTVTVSSFRALPATGVIPNFEIGLHVINPNPEALSLRGVAYTVSLAGHELIKGVGNNLPVIEGYGEGDLMLTASANLIAGIRLVSDLMSRPGETMPYEFAAKLDIGAFRPAIRVKEAGEIALNQ
jgi:LEA14-like dessication related protein